MDHNYTLARLARIPCLVNLAGELEKVTPKMSSLRGACLSQV